MPVPGFGIAPAKHFVIAIEKQGGDLEIAALAQSFGGFREIRNVEVAGPDIDADRQRPGKIRPRTDQIGQQGERQIVDRFETDIFERFERN